MCLAIPGELVEIVSSDPLMRIGRVRFGGIVKEVNLAYVPEAEIGDFVTVHVGFGLSVVNREEAARVFTYLREIDQLGELEEA